MEEKKVLKSVYDVLKENSEAIGANDVAVEGRGIVGEGKSFSRKNMAYCSNCGDLVPFTVQDEIVEEEFRGIKNKEITIKFPFRIGRCKECGHEVATDNDYNFRRTDAKWKAYREQENENERKD